MEKLKDGWESDEYERTLTRLLRLECKVNDIIDWISEQERERKE